jgi:hypothetical protein
VDVRHKISHIPGAVHSSLLGAPSRNGLAERALRVYKLTDCVRPAQCVDR